MKIFAKPPAAKVIDLLAACSLPTADLRNGKLDHFFGCGTEGDLRGVVGVELCGGTALLRSLAVAEEARKSGCGTRLVQEAEKHARSCGAARIYLLTTTAETFFAGLGYAKVDRESVPDEIRSTTEFSTLCPASASVMLKYL